MVAATRGMGLMTERIIYCRRSAPTMQHSVQPMRGPMVALVHAVLDEAFSCRECGGCATKSRRRSGNFAGSVLGFIRCAGKPGGLIGPFPSQGRTPGRRLDEER
jgi:hypothetical protein